MNNSITNKVNDITKVNTSAKRQSRLHKYSLGSKSLAIIAGVLGQHATSNASVQVLNLDGPNVDETLIAGGGGTAGNLKIYNLDSSTTDTDDDLLFAGTATAGGILRLFARNDADVFTYLPGGATKDVIRFYAIGATVDGSLNTASSQGYIDHGSYSSEQGVWESNQNGAIGFKTGDNQFGFINVDWNVSTRTLTILGGSYESTASTSLVVTSTAVPEPSEYAAALGLGALGLAYYRRRSGNKTRSKN